MDHDALAKQIATQIGMVASATAKWQSTPHGSKEQRKAYKVMGKAIQCLWTLKRRYAKGGIQNLNPTEQ